MFIVCKDIADNNIGKADAVFRSVHSQALMWWPLQMLRNWHDPGGRCVVNQLLRSLYRVNQSIIDAVYHGATVGMMDGHCARDGLVERSSSTGAEILPADQ